MWAEVTACLARALREKVASALVLLAWRGREKFCHAAGQCDEHTVFDLASLTKPLATTLLALRMELPWHTSLHEIWGNSVPEDKRRITVLQLLCHCSGLPAWQPYYEHLLMTAKARRNQVLLNLLLREKLAYAPDSRALYSDLGFMLLGLILQEHYHAGLQTILQKAFSELQIHQPPFYLPIGGPVPANTAPCGSQPWLGRDFIKGRVEDENAWAMGGVAAHAGLFGNAHCVRELLRKVYRAERAQQIWRHKRLKKIYHLDKAASTRTAGFDTPGGACSGAGGNYPEGVIGHLGFTGVSFWYQPQDDIGVVLLSNRVVYGRDNWRIRQLRPRLHNLLWPLLTERKPHA